MIGQYSNSTGPYFGQLHIVLLDVTVDTAGHCMNTDIQTGPELRVDTAPLAERLLTCSAASGL